MTGHPLAHSDIDGDSGVAESGGERCRNSLHEHGLSLATPGGGGLLDWEAARFQQAADRLGLEPATTCALHCAARSVEVELPLERDDGSLEVYTGYRVQHSHALGPAKGGIRYHRSVGVAEVTALARLMTWKTALAGLPFGGAKGGIPCEPARLSSREVQRLTHLYTVGILPVIGPDTDVVAPDLGTTAETMGWILHAAEQAGRGDPRLVTGKPEILGGTKFRAKATGVGVAHVSDLAYRHLGGRIDQATVAIEGFGSVGGWAARELAERGASIVAVSDVTGGIHAQTGLDVEALIGWVADGRRLGEYPDADPYEGSVLQVPCDIAIPAAMEGTLDAETAKRVEARLVVEGANGPTTPEAEAILQEQGVAVVPDLVANAGGVISSYFEWVQNHQRLPWPEHEERQRVLDRLEQVWDSLSPHPPADWRPTALATAISRVVAGNGSRRDNTEARSGREAVTARPDVTVVGAGPAGLVAAATLARAGRSVRVYEKSDTVGHRFSGDFQGLESWSDADALDRLDRLGVETSFAHKPVSEVVFYDHHLRPVPVSAPAPLFYLVRRGPDEGTLDSALLDQARLAGAEVRLGRRADRADRGNIIAIGPRYADGLATGYVFPTDLEDQAHCIISDDLAPAGYAYLLVWDGQATLATCLFDRQQQWRQARGQTVEMFSRIVGGLDLTRARAFSGYGSVFGTTRYADEAGRLYAGEAAGLQDPEWGFGMWYAMESGALGARSHIEGFDYEREARRQFDPRRDATFANRVLYERLPSAAVPWLFRRAARSPDIRSRLGRHWSPSRWKSRLADYYWPRFAQTRLHHRDRACHSPTCDCVWCTHGDQHISMQPETNQKQGTIEEAQQ